MVLLLQGVLSVRVGRVACVEREKEVRGENHPIFWRVRAAVHQLVSVILLRYVRFETLPGHSDPERHL